MGEGAKKARERIEGLAQGVWGHEQSGEGGGKAKL